MKPIDFWYSIGSTYSYLTVMRLADYEAQTGVTFNWRPFDVRAIMIEQKNIPFANKPEKFSYMWRDIERRAAKYGLPISVPAPYPLKELAFANQVALWVNGKGGGGPIRLKLSGCGLWMVSLREANPIFQKA